MKEACIFHLILVGILSVLILPVNSLIANITKWSNTLKQFVSNLPTNCLSVFDHFVILVFNCDECYLSTVPYWQK